MGGDILFPQFQPLSSYPAHGSRTFVRAAGSHKLLMAAEINLLKLKLIRKIYPVAEKVTRGHEQKTPTRPQVTLPPVFLLHVLIWACARPSSRDVDHDNKRGERETCEEEAGYCPNATRFPL